MLYDRVYEAAAFGTFVPADISVYGASTDEIWSQILIFIASHHGELSQRVLELLKTSEYYPLWETRETRPFAPGMPRTVLVLPAAAFPKARVHEVGSHEVLCASIANLGVVDESRLSWDQVRHFRADTKARKDYAKLLHWLDKEMVGKTPEYVSDEMTERLENYETALRKHGIEIALGAVEHLLDPSFMAATSMVAAGVALASTPAAAVGTALTITAGKIICKVGRDILNLQQHKREYGEIAFISRLAELS